MSLLERAFCLPPPPGTPREIYSLMVHCWWVHQYNISTNGDPFLIVCFSPLSLLLSFTSLIFPPFLINPSSIFPCLSPNSIHPLSFSPRNPDKSLRPSFPALCSHLSLPVSQLLHWSTEDTTGVGPRALMIGAPLKTAHALHINLQKYYVHNH